jgi:uncharacterized membrane protein YraQ (UPF0718 family)/copper chaperone CopZ
MFTVLQNILIEFWFVLSEMAPYLLLGFFVAGVLSVVISAQTVERHLGGKGAWPVVKATIFGIPLPLCSCGVIPVAASLRQHGASRGATTAFLLSTPQTGVDSIMVTFSLLGPVFTVFRPLAAFITGIFGGSIIDLLERNESVPETAPNCANACCSTAKIGNRLSHIFHYGFVSLPRDIGKALLIGLIIAGLISALIPDDYLSGVLGAGIGAMIVMMLLGIPVYVCATASVPVAAALIAKGISPGAALVFLLTGPATNAAAITTIWKIMGRRTAVTYLLTVAITALASGLFLDYIFSFQGLAAPTAMPGMLPEYIKTVSAVVLLSVLGAAIWWPSRQGKRTAPQHQERPTITLSISGMTCQHCVQSVQRALSGGSGVQSVEVDLKEGKARITGDHLDISQLRGSVEALGYAVDCIEE